MSGAYSVLGTACCSSKYMTGFPECSVGEKKDQFMCMTNPVKSYFVFSFCGMLRGVY
jgi:hypothetical protein